ncbi:MAG: hypothetical protein K2Y56_19885 [Methylobacterium sp.]|uniref:hypothetical protein n=1 Tax=Methylobacterium sp. TaxID=409 RepID=UPI0025FEF3A0|nr:hypothetical protein [Methylobacterium sp.]MBX9933750.1 hypothetical protein [Methylobacterium sp.]
MLIAGIDSSLYGVNAVSTTAILELSTYCGGLHITKGARVTLQPGVYIMKNGPLVVDKASSFTGTNVGFYFMGIRAGLIFDEDVVISLTAPKDGPMSGLLFSEERSVLNNLPLSLPSGGKGLAPRAPCDLLGQRDHRIISNDARTRLGTIYLPVGRLIVDSKTPVADQSAYKVIIARQINLYEGPDLIVKARYGATNIPVPPRRRPKLGRYGADAVVRVSHDLTVLLHLGVIEKIGWDRRSQVRSEISRRARDGPCSAFTGSR